MESGYADNSMHCTIASPNGSVVFGKIVLKKIKRKSRDARINRNEVDILKNLNHMYLPQVVDFFEENVEIYTAMSFIPGRSLKELMEERRQFSLAFLYLFSDLGSIAFKITAAKASLT